MAHTGCPHSHRRRNAALTWTCSYKLGARRHIGMKWVTRSAKIAGLVFAILASVDFATSYQHAAPSRQNRHDSRQRQGAKLTRLFQTFGDDQESNILSGTTSRRQALSHLAQGTTVAAVAVAVSSDVWASISELDEATGNLYTPRPTMLYGSGSDAARGLEMVARPPRRQTLKPGQPIQTVYGTRFITYLSRFLLNFDPSARAWWVQQGFG
jgi:hypothetical protein